MNLFVVIIVFIIIAFVTAFVLNLNREKKFENSLSSCCLLWKSRNY